jgi:hypothetical protein
LCFDALKESLEHLKFKVKVITITKNIKTNLSKEALYQLESYLHNLFEKTKTDNQFHEKNPKIVAKKLRQLKTNKYSGSDVFSFNNFFNNSVISIYIKNRKQFISKLVRTTMDNYNTLVKAIERLNFIDFPENILRIELTIFDFNSIMQQKYYDLLDDLEKFINETISWMEIEDKKTEQPIIRFQRQFEKTCKSILKNWYYIADLDSENGKLIKKLDDG